MVSVIIPAYNAEVFIEATLLSVLAQTHSNIEVLVVDDGSTDRTAEIVQRFAEQDSRISLFRSSNQGVAAARNLGIDNARGEYIAPLDADDIWYPRNLEKQLECFSNSGPEVGLVYAWSTNIDENDELTGGYKVSDVEGEVSLSLVYSNFIGNGSAPVIRRGCLEHVGGYDSKYRECGAEGVEDYDLYIRIAEHYRFGLVREFLIGYRIIEDSMSCNTLAMDKGLKLILADAQRRYPELPKRIFRWAESHYCEYLGYKCNYSGDLRGALRWLSRAAIMDPVLLFYRRFYLRNFLRLIEKAMRRGDVLARNLFGLSPSTTGSPVAATRLTMTDIERLRDSKLGAWDALQKRRMGLLRDMETSGQSAISETGRRK